MDKKLLELLEPAKAQFHTDKGKEAFDKWASRREGSMLAEGNKNIMRPRMESGTLVLSLYNQIGPYKFDEFKMVDAEDFGEALEFSDADNVRLNCDSPGGSISIAKAMVAQMQRQQENGRKFELSVDGICGSAATYFLCAADKRTSMPLGNVMIHQSSGVALGNAQDLESVAKRLRMFDQEAADLYAETCGSTRKQMLSMMEEETFFSAKEALDIGFVQSITGRNAAEKTEEPAVSSEMLWRHVAALAA